MAAINFNSKLINKYLRKYLKIENEEQAITENMIEDIKYIYLSTTHGYSIAFGKGTLPEIFEFDDCGDEWWCLCMKDTNRFESYKDFITVEKIENIYTLKFTEEPDELNCNDNDMKEFNNTVQKFWADVSDYNTLEKDEEGNTGFVNADDLKHFKNVEVVRLMDCEMDIHSLNFINALPNLKVLEIGRIQLHDLEGLEKLNKLEHLCIW